MAHFSGREKGKDERTGRAQRSAIVTKRLGLALPTSKTTMDRCVSPEESLWLDVFFRALDDYAGLSRDLQGTTERSRCQRNAAEWFVADSPGIGSFLFCCETLEIDPGAVRRALRNATTGDLCARLRLRSAFIERPSVDAVDNPNFDCDAGRRVSV